ncbi:DNA-binding protein [Algoriphagus sp. AGSA1]|uniref:DNA-binding protein n=1 Tax=Algoriphagus sp. AGSA1 TaxID=2907213 RepID=UPI001F25317B|nr:DNA-binding protein [Algoriphagus sp. AGSA1]MCE7056874.1 DNA-binding protein [Algoriphagus sp. AGSA1]
MNVICLEDDALYALVDKVVQRLKEQSNMSHDKWISGEQVMQMMHIKSKTTLQKLRDTGAIRFTQPEKKIILYDIDSVNEYLEKHSRETF